MVVGGFCWSDILDRFKKVAIVEPVQCGVFPYIQAVPWSASGNDLCLEVRVSGAATETGPAPTTDRREEGAPRGAFSVLI